jgi:NTP pyrophosphatase (non-canonical NTP hydrolase)
MGTQVEQTTRRKDMGYMTDGLTFNVLRAANQRRLPTFKNAKGGPAHEKPDGSDWKLSAWSNASFGELGEAANLIKKIERGDFTLDEARDKLADELADAVTYIDLLAARAGINLGQAVIRKFNVVSKRVDSDISIREDGSDWYYNKDLR